MVKELIRNGGFERGNLDFWEVVEGNIGIDSGVKKRGNYSAKMICSNDGYAYFRYKDFVEVTPYTIYKFSGWLKSVSLQAMNVYITFCDSDYEAIQGSTQNIYLKNNTFDWTLGTGWICVQEEGSYLRLHILGSGLAGTYGYVDSFSLQELDIHRISVYTKELLRKENFTSTGIFYSDEYFSGIWKYGEFYLNVSSLTGSSPTLDVTIQAYDPSTTVWKDIVVFDQATAAGSQLKVATAGLGWKLRVKYVTGGTITDCDFVVGAVFKR